MLESTRDLLAECRASNPLHHLWNNNGTWWLHCTVHRPDYTKDRVRLSLRTADLEEAMRRRDAELLRLARLQDVELSIRTGRRVAA